MTDGFPITINMEALLGDFNEKNHIADILEAWFNFQALAKGWFGDEACINQFTFYLVTQAQFTAKLTQLSAQSDAHSNTNKWQIDTQSQTAFMHNKAELSTQSFIAITEDDLALAQVSDKQFEARIKQKVLAIANPIAQTYQLTPIKL